MIIRWMKIEDLTDVLEIEAQSFTTPWQRASFEQELLMNTLARYLVAEIDGRIAGYMGCWHVVDEGHITNVAVHPTFRRRGVARALIEALLQYSRENGIDALTLEVRVSNAAAIALYASYGFVKNGLRPQYYQDTKEDALIMWAKVWGDAQGDAQGEAQSHPQGDGGAGK